MVYVYRQHAIRRMFERGIAEADVQAALEGGQVIEDYPEDYPLPSCLWLGQFNGKPLHIVFADNPAQWNADFTARIEL